MAPHASGMMTFACLRTVLSSLQAIKTCLHARFVSIFLACRAADGFCKHVGSIISLTGHDISLTDVKRSLILAGNSLIDTKSSLAGPTISFTGGVTSLAEAKVRLHRQLVPLQR